MLKDVATTASFDAKPRAWNQTAPQRMASGAGAPTRGDGSWDIVRIVTRTLRGRYRLTLVLFVLASGMGAAAGWSWAGPLYRSDGMVRITSALPAVLQQTDQNQPIPMFDSFMEAQQGLVTSRSLLEKAMQDPIWEAKGIGNNRPSVSDLAANLKVEVRAKSENLHISYVNPVAAVASAAVSSTISAYQDAFVQENQKLDQQRLQLLADYGNKLAKKIEQGKSENIIVAPTTAPVAPATQAAPQEAPIALTPSSSEFEAPSAA